MNAVGTRTTFSHAPSKRVARRVYVRAQNEAGLLRDTLQIVAQNAFAMIGAQAALVLIWLLAFVFALGCIAVLVGVAHLDAEVSLGILVVVFQLSIIPLIAILYYAVVFQASEACTGLRPRISSTLRRISVRGIGALVLANVILLLAAELPFIAFYGAAYVIEALQSDGAVLTAAGIGILLTIIFGIVAFRLVVRLIFVNQVIIVERRGVVDAMKRSSSIVKGRFWQVARGVIVGLFCSALLVVPASIYAQVASAAHSSSHIVVAGMFYAALNCVSFIASGTYLTLFYYSLRLQRHDITLGDVLDYRAYEAL